VAIVDIEAVFILGNIPEAKIRHLEMIQAVVTRMANNSFMLKGWSVTLIAGIFVLASKDSNQMYLLVAYVPIILFWFLDSYYLQLERKYRVLYNRIRVCEEADQTFDLSAPASSKLDKTYYTQSLFSRTEFWFYFPTALLVATVARMTNFC